MYFAIAEPTNKFDHNAVAVFEDRDCRMVAANIERDCTRQLNKLWKSLVIISPVIVKAKSVAKIFNRKIGPVQMANIGFKINAKYVQEVKTFKYRI